MVTVGGGGSACCWMCEVASAVGVVLMPPSGKTRWVEICSAICCCVVA